MCNKITKISVQNRYQWVGICSHGSAHIFWRTTHICMPFKDLEGLMNQALAGRLPVEGYGNQSLLWLNNSALRLSDSELTEIQALLAYAAETRNESQVKLRSDQQVEGKVVLH